MKNLSALLFTFTGILIVTFAWLVLGGFVLSIIWEWFIVSTLNLSPITIPQSIGILLVVNLLTNQVGYQKIKHSEDENPGLKLLMIFLWPLITLFIAWIITWFM